jgi:uncharacterized protein YihD (DUF1040 family)
MGLKTTVLVSTLLMTGCSFLPKPPQEVKIITKPVERQIAQPVLPRAIDLKEPYWYVVSNENLEEFLANIEKESGTMVFFAMSVPDYELMAYNMQEIKRYVREMKEVIVYYKKVTTNEQRSSVQPVED